MARLQPEVGFQTVRRVRPDPQSEVTGFDPVPVVRADKAEPFDGYFEPDPARFARFERDTREGLELADGAGDGRDQIAHVELDDFRSASRPVF